MADAWLVPSPVIAVGITILSYCRMANTGICDAREKTGRDACGWYQTTADAVPTPQPVQRAYIELL